MKLSTRYNLDNLSAREKLTVAIGAMVLVVLLFGRFIWWPSYHRFDVLSEDLLHEQDLNSWMQQAVHRIETLKSTHRGGVAASKSLNEFEKSLNDTGLRTYVTSLSTSQVSSLRAQRSNLEIASSASHSRNDEVGMLIALTFKEVPLILWLDWIEEEARRGWHIETVELERTAKPGVVDVTMVAK